MTTSLTGMARRKSSFSLTLLLLPAMMWLFFNTTVNRHIHVLSDGYVITHSHPFAKNQTDSVPSTSHQHTEKELLLFSLFSEIVFSLISLLILRAFLHTYPQILRFRFTHLEPARKYFQVHHYHAPPCPC
ncbi:MAG: hypothetical protein ABFS38_06445 [Bacteroidota bacterium]